MEDVPVPKPGPGEVLVKVTFSLKGILIKKRSLRSGSPTVLYNNTTKVEVGEPAWQAVPGWKLVLIFQSKG